MNFSEWNKLLPWLLSAAKLRTYTHINKADTLIIPLIPSDDIKIDVRREREWERER